MAARKTVKVADLVNRANHMLQWSADDLTRERQAIAVFVEGVLHDANGYAGYTYLATQWDPDAAALRDGYDDTRRRYYVVH